MLSFCTKNRVQNRQKEETVFLYIVSIISLFGLREFFFLHLLSNKTRNCLFFDLLRGFLTLATLFGSYIFSYLSQ